MSVNIVQNGELLPIAGKTVPMPTPDYVDEQYNPSTTYSKGMTCIEGNVRYRYKNSTATSGHRPPNTTYWEVLSVADELNNVMVGQVTASSASGATYYRNVLLKRNGLVFINLDAAFTAVKLDIDVRSQGLFRLPESFRPLIAANITYPTYVFVPQEQDVMPMFGSYQSSDNTWSSDVTIGISKNGYIGQINDGNATIKRIVVKGVYMI